MAGEFVVITENDRPRAPTSAGSAGDTGSSSEQPSTPTSGGEPFKVSYVPDPNRFGRCWVTKPIVFEIPSTEPALSQAMTREVLGAYIVHGWGGVRQLGVGVFGLDAYTAFLQKDGLNAKRFWGPAKGDEAYQKMGDAVDQDRRPLWTAFETARRELRKRAVAMEKSIAAEAVAVGLARTARCRALLIAEATRYLSLAEPRATMAKKVLAGGSSDARAQAVAGLRGPEGPALLAALRQILPQFRNLNQERRDLLRTKGLELADRVGTLGAVVAPALLPFAGLARAAKPDADTAAMQARAVAIATEDFALLFGRLAGGYPILFRLVEADPDDERAIALALVEILQDAWKACADLESDLGSSDVVWTLPALVQRTVKERFGGRLDFAERVAADAIKFSDGKVHPFEAINYLVSGLDSSLMLVPFPPLQLAMLIISMLAAAGEMAETWVRDAGRRHSARAALDPSLALAAEPSMLGMVVQAVFLAIGVLPLPGLAQEVRALRKRAAVIP